jgi:hypothetical protein|tara:strand:+ start:273 stop:566 length:294 start_codon:yes stop_codon:yes gene_type:complete
MGIRVEFVVCWFRGRRGLGLENLGLMPTIDGVAAKLERAPGQGYGSSLLGALFESCGWLAEDPVDRAAPNDPRLAEESIQKVLDSKKTKEETGKFES